MICADRFLDIADLLPEPMFLLGRPGNVVAANTAALHILDIKAGEDADMSFYDIVDTPPRKTAEYLRACFRSAEMVLGAVDLLSSTGDIVAMRTEGCLAQLRTDRHPALILLRCLDKRKSNARFLELNSKLNDITRERILQRQSADDLLELQRMALADSLTSLPNRRSLDKNLNHEWKRGAREGKHMSILLLDIDCFKAFNDTYGHLAGDACLKQVAHTVQIASQRPADLTARYGGEEFAVLLPSTGQEGAITVAERIRSAVEELNIPHKTSDVSTAVTVSVGIATLAPSLVNSPLELVHNADKALYQAKRLGRNRVHVYQRILSNVSPFRLEPDLEPGKVDFLESLQNSSSI
ncbi:MAG TPA: diguanylate cyclase [Gammaproteobacteria bacterium]